MTIGEKIRMIRKEKGLTQKQVGERCGMADSAVRKYESGAIHPKLETIFRIAAALEVEPIELLEIDSPHVPQTGFHLSSGKQPRIINEQNQKRLASFINKLDPNTQITESGIVGYFKPENKELLLGYFSKLNPDGQRVALDRVEELTEIPRYQKNPSQDEAQDGKKEG